LTFTSHDPATSFRCSSESHIPIASVPTSASRITTGLLERMYRLSKSSADSSLHSSEVSASMTSTWPPRLAAQSAARSTSGTVIMRGFPLVLMPPPIQASLLAADEAAAMRLGMRMRAALHSTMAKSRMNSFIPHEQRIALKGARDSV